MIDIHCHILPGADDGADSVEESLAMVRMAVADGIRTIVATPHTLNGVYQNSRTQIVDRVRQLQAAVDEAGLPLTLCPGSDVHICAGMAECVKNGQMTTLNDTGKYMLVEFPGQSIPPGYEEELFQLRLNGITSIVTHPERHPVLRNRLELMAELCRTGCLVQVTAMSVTGAFGTEAMESAHQMIRRRLVHFIATDAHSVDNRPPVLSEAAAIAAEILDDPAEAQAMVEERPRAVLDGRPVSLPELRQPPQKKWWQIF